MAATSLAAMKTRAEATRSPPADQTSRHATRLTNCRGLPDLPTKQTGGSWYRAPFLVTDNANIPYEPFTELQFDAPSTLQWLFHGAFAERDDF